jgi:hypothetical protein
VPAKPRGRFLCPAEFELHGSADRYNEERSGRGGDFLRVVRAAIEEVAEVPGRWPCGPHAHRRVFSRFPFTIHYRFDAREIVIMAVAHQKRRPGYWSRRR